MKVILSFKVVKDDLIFLSLSQYGSNIFYFLFIKFMKKKSEVCWLVNQVYGFVVSVE